MQKFPRLPNPDSTRTDFWIHHSSKDQKKRNSKRIKRIKRISKLKLELKNIIFFLFRKLQIIDFSADYDAQILFDKVRYRHDEKQLEEDPKKFILPDVEVWEKDLDEK